MARHPGPRNGRKSGALAVALGALAVGCGALLGLDDDGTTAPVAARPDGAAEAPLVDATTSDALVEAPRPSCVGLATSCPGETSCCASTFVPGGSFFRSYDGVAGGGWEDKGAPATVLPFYLDRYEVVVGRFRAFVAANLGTRTTPPKLGAGSAPGLASTGWTAQYTAALETDTVVLRTQLATSVTPALSAACSYASGDAGRDMTAMNCVTWYEAFAFCIWDGGRLPTETEWNYAGAGGAAQRSYPWSTPSTDRTLASTHATFGVDGGKPASAGSHSPLGDGLFGQADLAGNVAEWVFDPFAEYPSPCVGSCVSTSGRGRQIRGGAYDDPPSRLLTASRGVYLEPPTRRLPSVGFRCARDLP